MFCGGCNGVSKESGKQARAVWTGDDSKRPDKIGNETGNTILNPEEVVKRKTEKRKLEDELKDVDAERKALVKEMKKLASERNKVLNKRKIFIRSKNENIKLEEKISNQKKVWLSKQLRKKGVDGPAVLKEVAEMVEKLVEIQEEAQKEWDKITKIRAGLKERRAKVDEAREKLTTEQEEFSVERNEFEQNTGETIKRIEATYAEQQRLKDLDVNIQERQKIVENQTKHYNELDITIEARVEAVGNRETAITQRDEELKRENGLVGDITRKMYSSMEQKRAIFNQNFILLTTEYFKWAAGYSDLFDGTEQEMAYTASVKEAESIIGDNERALEKLPLVTLAQPELLLGSRKTEIIEEVEDLAEDSKDREALEIPEVEHQVCDDSKDQVLEKVSRDLNQGETSKGDNEVVQDVNEIEAEKGSVVESQDESKQERKEEEAEDKNQELPEVEVLKKVATSSEESRVKEEPEVIVMSEPVDDQSENKKIEADTKERVVEEPNTSETKDVTMTEKSNEVKEEPDKIETLDAQEPIVATAVPEEAMAAQIDEAKPVKEPEPTEEADMKEPEKKDDTADDATPATNQKLEVAEPLDENAPVIIDMAESIKETTEENFAIDADKNSDDPAVSSSVAEKSEEAKDVELEDEIVKNQQIDVEKVEPKESKSELKELASDLVTAVNIKDEGKTEVEVSREIQEVNKKTVVLPTPEVAEEKPINEEEVANEAEKADDVKQPEPKNIEKDKSEPEKPGLEQDDGKAMEEPVVEHSEQTSNVTTQQIPEEVVPEPIRILESKPEFEKQAAKDAEMKSIEDSLVENEKGLSDVLKETETEVIKQLDEAKPVERSEQTSNVPTQQIPEEVVPEPITILESKPEFEKQAAKDAEMKSIEDSPVENEKGVSDVLKETETEVIKQLDEAKPEKPQAVATTIINTPSAPRTESGVMKGTEEVQELIPEAIEKYDDSKDIEKVGELEVLADKKVPEEKEVEAEASKQPKRGVPEDLVVRVQEEVRPTSEDSKELKSGEIKDVPDQTLETQKVETVQESVSIEVKNELPSEELKDENETDIKKVEEELSKQSNAEANEDLKQEKPNEYVEGKEPSENEGHKTSKDIVEDGKEAEVEVEDAEKPHISEDIDRRIEVTKKADVQKEVGPIPTELADEKVAGAQLHDEKKELEITEDSQIPDSKVLSSTEKSSTAVEGTSETKDVDEKSKPNVTELPEQVKDECTSVPEAEANVPETQETKETEERVSPAGDKLAENDEKKELEITVDSQISDSKVLSSTEKSSTAVEGTSETKDVDEKSKPDVKELPVQVKDDCTSVPEAEANVPEAQETKETEACVSPAGVKLDENVPESQGSTEVKEDTSLIGDKSETKDVEETAKPETKSVLETDESKVVPKAEPTELESEDLNKKEESKQQQGADLEANEVIDDVKPEGMEQVIDNAISNQQKNVKSINQAEDTKEEVPEVVSVPTEELERVTKLEQESEAKDAEATPEPESVTDPAKDVDAKGKSESTVLVKRDECKASLQTTAKNTDMESEAKDAEATPEPESVTDPAKEVDAKGKSESTVLVKREECKASLQTKAKNTDMESEAKDAEATPKPKSVTDPAKDVDTKGKSESTVLVKSEECKASLQTRAKNTDIRDISETGKSSTPEVIVCDEDRSDDLKPEEKEVEVLETAAAKKGEISEANTGTEEVKPRDESSVLNAESKETPKVVENEKKSKQLQELEKEEEGDEIRYADARVQCEESEQKETTDDTPADDKLIPRAEPDKQKEPNGEIESKVDDSVINTSMTEQKPDVAAELKEDKPSAEQQAEKPPQKKLIETDGNINSVNIDVPTVAKEEPKVLPITKDEKITDKATTSDDCKEEESPVIGAKVHDTKETDTVSQEVKAISDDSVIKPIVGEEDK